MSKTLLQTADVPEYIKEIVKNLRATTDYSEGDVPGYTFKLYGKHRVSERSEAPQWIGLPSANNG